MFAKDQSAIEEILDKELPLNLHIIERNKKIENLINQRIGDLMVEINKNLQVDMDESLRNDWLAPAVVSWNRNYLDYGEKSDKVVVGYNFAGINYSEIIENAKNAFTVKLKIDCVPQYREETRPIFASSFGSHSYRRNRLGFFLEHRTYALQVECNLDVGGINYIHFIGPASYAGY